MSSNISESGSPIQPRIVRLTSGYSSNLNKPLPSLPSPLDEGYSELTQPSSLVGSNSSQESALSNPFILEGEDEEFDDVADVEGSMTNNLETQDLTNRLLAESLDTLSSSTLLSSTQDAEVATFEELSTRSRSPSLVGPDLRGERVDGLQCDCIIEEF